MRLLTQTDLDDLLIELEKHKADLLANEKLSFASFLRQQGFLPHLEAIDFSINQKLVNFVPGISRDKKTSTINVIPRSSTLLTNIDFSECVFKDCHFDYCDLSHSPLSKTPIEHCSFNHTIINFNDLHDVKFINQCIFNTTSFDYSDIFNTVFQQSIIFRSSFNQLSKICALTFEDCTITETSMIGGDSGQDIIAKSSSKSEISLITDKVIHTEKVVINNVKATILLSWSNKVPGIAATLTENVLVSHNFCPLRMDYAPPVDEQLLEIEINDLFALTTQKMNLPGNKTKSSFSMLFFTIMRERNAEDATCFQQMAALYQYAKSMYDKVDGIVIPGGQDIDPRFYGMPRDTHTILPNYYLGLTDPRRDILEFSLTYIQQCGAAPKPLFGICRGSQIIAAYYNATMYQSIEDPKRWSYYVEPIIPHGKDQPLSEPGNMPELSTRKWLRDGILKTGTLNVLFLHHQGYNLKTATGLAATASTVTESGIPIDIVGEHLQQNIIITQSHPEFAYDKTDTAIGIAAKVSEHTLNCLFSPFFMRVAAFQGTHSPNLVYSIKKLSYFFSKSKPSVGSSAAAAAAAEAKYN